MTALARRVRRHEHGVTLGSTLIIMLVITLIGGVIITSALDALSSATRNANKVAGLPAADSGIAKIRFALDSGLMSEADGFTLDADDLTSIAGDATWIPNTSDRVPADLKVVDSAGGLTPPGRTPSLPVAFTMVEPEVENRSGYWQIVRTIPPDYATTSQLVVYLRAWMSDASGRTKKARMLRIVFGNTPFSNYQLVSDTSIQLEAGANVGGPIHTNGYPGGNQAATGDAAVSAAGSVSCTPQARVTSARGDIDGLPSGCRTSEATGNTLDLSAARDATDAAAAACPVFSRCIAPAGEGAWHHVELAGNVIRWSRCDAGGCSGSTSEPVESAATPGAPGEVLLFDGDVNVAGTLSGRATVMAGSSSGGSPTIQIVGNTGSAAGSGNALGLVSLGNITIAATVDGSCAVTSVRAALMAANGPVAIPESLRSQTPQAGAVACATPLTITGSIVSRDSPVLVWSWGSTHVGYSTRTYAHDPLLRDSVPPLYPAAKAWSSKGWRDVGSGCLKAARWDDRSCK